MLRTLSLLALLLATPLSAQPDVFDWTVGRWEGVRRDAATGMEEPLRVVVEPILGGTGLLRRIEVDGAQGIYRGLTVQVYDPASDRWRWSYTSEGRGWFAEYAAESIDGKRSVWAPAEPRVRDSRVTVELLPDGLWRHTMEVSEDEGASWRVLWVDELRRAGAAEGAMEPQPVSSGGARTFVWDCTAPDGETFSVTARTGPGELAVWLPPRFGRSDLVLGQVRAASGAKYEGDGVVVWTQGDEALVEVDGATYPGCRPSAADSPSGTP
jgi:membrane-bound inhibitor of C-type lysozyme